MNKNKTIWEKIHNTKRWGAYPDTTIIKEVCRYKQQPQPGKKGNKQPKALDIGCGIGANTWFLTEQGYETHGIDYSAHAIRRAKEHLQQRRQEATLKNASATKLPYNNKNFQIIIDCHSIQHIPEDQKTINECHRVLKTRGRLISLLVAHDPTISENYGYVKYYTIEMIQKLFKKFKKVDVTLQAEFAKKGNTARWLVVATK